MLIQGNHGSEIAWNLIKVELQISLPPFFLQFLIMNHNAETIIVEKIDTDIARGSSKSLFLLSLSTLESNTKMKRLHSIHTHLYRLLRNKNFNSMFENL